MKNSIFIATSLDGYIAQKDGNIDWLVNIPNPTNSDYGFKAFMDSIDAIVMGRNTFEVISSFKEWPYTKKIFVLSNSLQSVPEDFSDKAEVVSGKLTDIMDSLHSKGMYKLYIDGWKTIQSFLQEDLIDEMIITRASILLGDGIPLFTSLKHQLQFVHTETTVLNEHLVMSKFLRVR